MILETLEIALRSGRIKSLELYCVTEMSGNASDSSADPNLTPLLDMVFQLITFFMMVMNFKAAALDLTLKLPTSDSAGPVDTNGKDDLLIVNVNKEGTLVVQGSEREIERFATTEAESSRRTARGKGVDLKKGDELPTVIVIRCDNSTRFGALNKFIEACQKEGFRRFALKAKTEVKK